MRNPQGLVDVDGAACHRFGRHQAGDPRQRPSWVESSTTLLGQLDGVLQAAHELNVEDPTLALFVGTVRTEMRRFPEVAERLQRSVTARDEFFVSIVGAGVGLGGDSFR